jgi:hypothetical protein
MADKDGGIGEVTRGDVADPRVLDAVELNRDPGVVFILGILRVVRARERELVDADLFRHRVRLDDGSGATTVLLFQRGGDRGVDLDLAGRWIDRGNRAVPEQVVRPGRPVQAGVGERAGKAGHAQGLDPRCRAGAAKQDMLSDGEANGAGQLEGSRAYGSIIGDGDRSADGRIGFTAGFDEGATADAIRDDSSCGRTGAAQDDSARANLQMPAHVVGSGAQQNRAAKSIGLERQRRDVVDGVLQENRIVLAGGADGDHRLDCGQRLAGLVACDGEVDGHGALRCLRESGETARESERDDGNCGLRRVHISRSGSMTSVITAGRERTYPRRSRVCPPRACR